MARLPPTVPVRARMMDRAIGAGNDRLVEYQGGTKQFSPH
jgi:hypothetical protein